MYRWPDRVNEGRTMKPRLKKVRGEDYIVYDDNNEVVATCGKNIACKIFRFLRNAYKGRKVA